MCTVVTQWTADRPARILAIRDEFESREFDDPAAWWPEQPSVVGGRDRRAGGSWCVTDTATGVTALVLNRTERRLGTPTRGLLPLLAVRAGVEWVKQIDYQTMASFNLVYVTPAGVTVWIWDAAELRRVDLAPGIHVITTSAVDRGEVKAERLYAQFSATDWRTVLRTSRPVDDRNALIVRHRFETDTYATVFGQLITTEPGAVRVESSRTPWLASTWTERHWPS